MDNHFNACYISFKAYSQQIHTVKVLLRLSPGWQEVPKHNFAKLLLKYSELVGNIVEIKGFRKWEASVVIPFDENLNRNTVPYPIIDLNLYAFVIHIFRSILNGLSGGPS